MTATLFTLFVVLTVLSVVSLYTFLCMYVYNDAKLRTDKPFIWLLITLFTPNMFGFLIYIIAGRDKNKPGSSKYKTPAIISAAAAFVMTAALLSTVIFSSNVPLINNVSIGMVNNNIGSQWSVSYKSSGETLERTITFTNEELESLTLESSCDEGKIYILWLQGENAKVIDISDYEKGTPDLSMFSDGKIKISLYNEGARNAKIKLDW